MEAEDKFSDRPTARKSLREAGSPVRK